MRAVLSGLMAAFALVALVGPALAQGIPAARAAALLDQAKAASGGAAWDRLGGWHESGLAIVAEAQGSYDAWCDLHQIGMRNDHVLAGASQTRGFDGTSLWLIDAAGQTHSYASPQALAIARQGAYVSAWGFFFPDRFVAQRIYIGSGTADGADFDIVQVTPQDGLPMELWIDRKSHLITRMVDRSGPRTSVAILSDFHAINGLLTPFVVAESDGDPKHTLELHIAAIDFNPIDRARFAPPAK